MKGVKIKIDRNSDLIGKNLFGHSYGNKITLYPDAFRNTETLVKTLGYERIHVYQTKILGAPTSSQMLNVFEKAARHQKKIGGHIIN